MPSKIVVFGDHGSRFNRECSGEVKEVIMLLR